MIDYIISSAPIFLLIVARCFALFMTVPLFSSRSVSRVAKLALTAYMAYMIFPTVSMQDGPYASYSPYIMANGHFSLEYILLLIGEVLIGVIIGFYISIIFAAFSTAGQFFAFQMGFAASEVYDSLSQVENPLMGQYLNLTAMLIFLQNNYFQGVFVNALGASFKSLNAFAIVTHSQNLMFFMLSSLTSLFKNAMILAMPIMGTLFLINVTMGILSKAAPQMNLLSEGFPILILTSFFIITRLLPDFVDLFMKNFVSGFRQIEQLFIKLSGGGV